MVDTKLSQRVEVMRNIQMELQIEIIPVIIMLFTPI